MTNRLAASVITRSAATSLLAILGCMVAMPVHGDTASIPQSSPAVLPQPVSLEVKQGVFKLLPTTEVVAVGAAKAEASKLVDTLAPTMGFRLKTTEPPSKAESLITLALDESLKEKLGQEGYTLDITTRRIEIHATGPSGLFYGIQTLRQLLPPEVFGKAKADGVDWVVPCVHIVDFPRFAWRGLLLDPARHFLPKADMLRFIDVMALHKFNRLQLHLTDDQGWRIEIKKYPRLTEIGAWRDETLIGHYRDKPWRFDGKRHGGFYTQDDMREIVQYAADRHITIMPEIEMPGHARAAIASYPHLGVFPEKQKGIKPWTHWGISDDILAPRPQTIEFCKDVLTEVMDLFPSRYIHIGGDEAHKTQWKASDEIQQMIRDLKLEDEAELQAWFTRQIDAFLTEHGRRLVGWDEILEGGLAPGAVVMSWRGDKGGITAAQAGHDVIMAPTSHTYFDYYQGPAESEPLAIGGNLPLEKVYGYEPIPAALSAEQAKHVLGAQAQHWREYIPDSKHLQYMAFPRACALSEVVWSPKENRNYDLFVVRLDHHLKRLAAAGVNYRPLDKKPMSWKGRTDPDAPKAARGLVQRLLPKHVDRFVFEVIPPVQGRDVFEVESRDGQIVIRGNTGVAMATGLNWYLENHCHCHVSWCGTQLNLPDPLPKVQPKVRRVTWARYRYFLNYCCFGYSLPWWDWDQWEKLIDWMALNGINAPLAVTGQEAVWQAVCKQLGISDEQISEFLAGPPFLPFQWMGCLDGWGGPLPQSWIDGHEELENQILARQRQLGMTPILQGFTGHVPAVVAEKYPDAKLHQIHWIEWHTNLLDPLDPLFPKIARLFMEEQTKRFGTDHLYDADTFIEMVPPSGELKDLADLSRAIYDGMAKTDPQAVWVLQGWTFSFKRSFWTQPRIKAFLGAVPDDRMLVLDLFCESRPMWSETEAFFGKPWAWCNVHNFGCTIFLGGSLPRINQNPHLARRDAKGGKLSGLGFVNEGLGYNPVVYDIMYETAWRNEPVDLDEWIRDFARHRYGQSDADAERSWQILRDTVYTAPFRTRSIISSLPTLSPARAAPYHTGRVAQAWEALLEVGDDLGDVDTYRFDLVNVARQSLSNHAADLQNEVAAAHRAKDHQAFVQASQRFLQLIRDLDELLATRREFLLGRCLEDAKRWGTTDDERARFEWNARRVLTLWGEGPAIDDYARKEWSGLLNGYYLKRWERFLDESAQALRDNKPFDSKAFNERLRPWMTAWSDQRETYPTEPRGDSVVVARRLWKKYQKAFEPDMISLTTGKPVTCSHALPPYPAPLANDGWSRNTDQFWATDVSQDKAAWWQVDLEQPTTVGRVVVVGYYGDQRYYGFTVETSTDGKTWTMAADHLDNKELSTAEGYTCRFEPRPTRYIRITQPHNSANTGRHLVEVAAYAK